MQLGLIWQLSMSLTVAMLNGVADSISFGRNTVAIALPSPSWLLCSIPLYSRIGARNTSSCTL